MVEPAAGGSPILRQARPGRAEAAAAIWDWRSEHSQTPAAQASRPRLRGTLQALVGAGIGALIFALLSRIAGTVVMSVAVVILLSALLSPAGLYAGIERLFAALGRRVGTALTWIVLPLLFYLVFLPFGMIFRSGRRDPMKRFYEADAESYWSPRQVGRSGSASRTRQY